VAIDLPGHGEGRVQDQMARIADYSDAIQGVLSEPALIVGHSMGAMIALNFASRFPDRVAGVVAMNAIFNRSDEAATAVLRRAAQLDGITVSDPTSTLQRWFGDKPSAARDACCDWLSGADPAGYRLAYKSFAASDGPTRAELSALQPPALFLTGSAEPNSTPQMSHAMANLSPRGRALIVPDAAHMMPMTHPEEVNTALMTFGEEVWT
jgi:pimeloyl-ACP methyl ester carboxylesterase